MSDVGDGAFAADPGWPWRSVWRLALSLTIFPMRTKAGVEPAPITTLRDIYLVFVVTPGLFLLVISFALPLASDSAIPLVTPLLLTASLGALLIARWMANRPPKCGSVPEVCGAYRSAFFVGIAIAQSAVLEGFVASFITGAYWPYVLGLVPGAIAYSMAAPTERNIRRIDERLRASGCETSLWTALLTPGAMPPGTAH